MAEIVDRRRFPCDYVGPTVRGGLKSGTACIVIARPAGGYKIRTSDGSIWTVDVDQVERVA